MSSLSRRGFLTGLGLLALTPQLAPGLAPGLAHAQAYLPSDPDIAGTLAYAVLDPATGEVLAQRAADLSLPPASTLKTVTALYALDRLGEGHRFGTRVIRSGNMLILAGGGDPVLDTDALGELAARVAEAEKASGLPPPTAFMVWGGALPRIERLDAVQDEHLPYNPSVSGMVLNFNRVHLGWRRGKAGHELSLQARGSKLSPRAYTVAIAPVDRRLPLFAYDGSGKRESWTVARSALGQSGSRWLPVRRPELYAGDVFQTLCRARGLVLPNPAVIELLPEGTEIARHDSPPLREIVAGMMEYSTNLTAEVLGLAASGAGDIPASARAMEEWLRMRGVSGDYRFHDHSGLSPENRMTARAMAQTVAGPGGARDLRGVMKDIALRDAKGKRIDSPISIQAKTGTLNFVSNLTGYAQKDGRQLVFSILILDEARHRASQGQELPEGVIGWTKRAKAAQQGLIEGWFAAGLARPPADGFAQDGFAQDGRPGSFPMPMSMHDPVLTLPNAPPADMRVPIIPGTGIFR
ncbi:D-alanyl-D-alanine carboxypeptidase/D-alanyl-D-alanine-endopeptidase [Paracoccus sp. (in: a-proteobacteria)]|uniref:D-alanyl-D-alanine carboxypeptidase/D-alanyl-D-alanine-endopeptidase n=1 Tax=Paracoccus sp. TaxID=267 RepID=UPI0035B252B8